MLYCLRNIQLAVCQDGLKDCRSYVVCIPDFKKFYRAIFVSVYAKLALRDFGRGYNVCV